MSKEEILNMFTEISSVILLLDKKKVGDDSFERLQKLVKKMTLLANRIERGEVGENSNEEKSEESEEEALYDKVDVDEESSEEDENLYDHVVDDEDENSDIEGEGHPPSFQTQTSNIGTSAKVMNAKAIHKSFLWMKKGLLKQDERLWSVLTPDGLYLYNSASDPVHKALIDPLQDAQVTTSPGNAKKFVITIDINGKKINYTFATDDESKTTEWIKGVNKASKWNLMDNAMKHQKKQKKKPVSRAVSVDVKKSSNLPPQNKTAKEKIYPKPKVKAPYARANTEMISHSKKEKPRSRSNTGAIKSPYGKTAQVSQWKQNTNAATIIKEKPTRSNDQQLDIDEYITPTDDKRQSIDEYMTNIEDEITANQINKNQVYDDGTTLNSDEDSDNNTTSTYQREQAKPDQFYDDTIVSSSEESDNPSKGRNPKSQHNQRHSGYNDDLNEDQAFSDDDEAYFDDGQPYVDDDQAYPNDDQAYLNDDQEDLDDYEGYTNADQEYYATENYSDFNAKQKPSNIPAKIMKGNAPQPLKPNHDEPKSPPRPRHDNTFSPKPPPKQRHDNTFLHKPLPPQKPKQSRTQEESSPGSSRPDSQSSIGKLKMKFIQNQEDRISVPSNSPLRKSAENLGPRANKSAPQSKAKPKKGRSKEPMQFKKPAPQPNLTLNDELASILAKRKKQGI